MVLLELPCLPDWYLHLCPIEIITQDPALNPCQCQMRCTVGNCSPPYSPSAVASTWHLSPAELLLECLTLDIKGAAPSPSWCGQLARDPGILLAGALVSFKHSCLQSHWNDSNIGLGVRTSAAPVWSIPGGDRVVAAWKQRNAILLLFTVHR